MNKKGIIKIMLHWYMNTYEIEDNHELKLFSNKYWSDQIIFLWIRFEV